MANPAIKNGYIPIANEIAEQLARHNIPGQEMRVIWVIWRKTWGFKSGDRRKDWDWISITQFEKFTGMKRVNVYKSIQSLLAKRLILQQGNKLKFNQNYNEWVLVKRLTVLAKRLTPISQKHNTSVSQKTTYKTKLTKETNTKENMLSKRKIKIKKTMEDLMGKEILLGEAPKTGTPSALDIKLEKKHSGSDFGRMCIYLGYFFNECYRKRFSEDYKNGTFSVSGVSKNISKYKEYSRDDWKNVIEFYFKSKKSQELVVTLEACLSENTIMEYKQKTKKPKYYND